MAENVTVVPYNAEWRELFRRLGCDLRAALQHRAHRIDHIGSTAIVGMSAKPVLDIQISVTSLEPMGDYKASLESVGFNWHRLAREHGTNRQAYTDAKSPFIWTAMRAATEWAQATGWQPGVSDA